MLTEAQRLRNPEDLHVYRVLNDAKWLLSQHHPGLLPKGEVHVEVVPLKQSIGATYDGFFRGVHYIFFPKKDPDTFDMLEILTGVHELAHVWHTESIGAEAFFGLNHDDHITDAEFREVGPYQAFKNARKRNKKISKRTTVSDAVAEGFAITIELSVLEKELGIARRLGRRQRIADLKEIRKGKRDALLYFKESKKKDPHFHADGVDMMNTLLARFAGDVQDLIDFVGRVDFRQTNKIKFGHPEYDTMVEDPLLLPRVHKSQLTH